MVRSLWSAASGMKAQQQAVDVISNNIANVNTVGYKTEKAEFKSLLYQTLQTRTTTANGEQKPISAQVGLGTRTASITSFYTQGAMLASESNTSFAIEGDGFFRVADTQGNTYYTRSGDFTLSVEADGQLALVNSDGLYVCDTNGNRIILPANVTDTNIYLSEGGRFGYTNDDGSLVDLNIQIGLWQFNNPAGLEKVGDSFLVPDDASGEAMNEATTRNINRSSLKQGYLEGSNVQVADEMVNLIIAQRAYELNSKAITTSDEMLGEANDLKR
jgi:flagellar basal-body rod protein FlgG